MVPELAAHPFHATVSAVGRRRHRCGDLGRRAVAMLNLELSVMSSSRPHLIGLHYSVPRLRPGWELSEETMPESVVHDQAVELLKAILAAWAARVGNAFIARNLAVRWEESQPRVGVDPDVSVLSPPPPDPADLRSVRTWLPGHTAPRLAIEVVSESNPHKDYAVAPEKYAACGVSELWIFDPLLSGPSAHGGPFRLHVWHRRDDGDLVRIHAGESPARSPTLGAWLVATDEGRKLRIADDESATSFWMTAEEAEHAGRRAERAAKEAERAAKESARAAEEAARAAEEAERAAKEVALTRIAELERALAQTKSR
jgi:Uma2 family endonuclease